MKESYKEQLAIDFGHKPYAGSGDAPGVASVFAKATPGQASLLASTVFPLTTDHSALFTFPSIRF